ncbi:MAG TPA: CoA-acylating methylmalonate-semialdehyde dehydrogenase [Thermoleophilia bacterium]|nr:CoA-acylating methylmalonate-semialdehyde dehydrogenase [Thermoleophilia bacterium]
MAEAVTGVQTLKYCIDGEWRESATEKYMPVTDSSTGRVFAETPSCTAAEVEATIESAQKAFETWSAKPASVRTQVLFRFRALVEEHMEELTFSTSREVGKNLDEARGEIVKIIEACEVAVAAPMLMKGESLMNVSTGHDTVTYREPLGVFAGIAPFNFPSMIPFGWMVPLCIATGNTMVIKAPSMVPTSSMRLLELLYEAGLPNGVVNLVTAGRKEAEIMMTHPLIRGINFVGSTSVGLHVYSVAAAHGKRVQAQTEAKNHGLVLADASLERAARGIINSTFGCAGMRCMALPVCVVEDAVADEFVGYMKQFAAERVVGCSYDPATELGPVVSAEHQQFIKGWIDKAEQEGADLILDGRDISVPGYEGGFFVGPSIFDHVTEDMGCGREEVFGPVLFVKRVSGFEEGITLMNNSRFANGSCIFTESGYYAREFTRRTHGGMVGINVGIPVPSSFFPFSGHKQSFFGESHVLGTDGIKFYTDTKSVTSRWFTEDDKATTKVSTWEGTITR